MRNRLAIVALGAVVAVTGCTASGAYQIPRGAEATSDAIQAAGDTRVAPGHSSDVLKAQPHGCVGPVRVSGPGWNACPNGPPRS
jgi:hypothetical protein